MTGEGDERRRFALNDRQKMLSGPLWPLLLAATIPLMLFGAWTAYRSAEEQRDSALRTARETVARVTERVTADIVEQVRVIETLAASSALDGPDLPLFYREAERVAASHPLWHTVELDDPKGEQVLNLLRPLGSPLGQTADRDTFEQVLRDHAPVVGGIGPVGPVSGMRLVAVRVPVLRDGTLVQVLTIALRPDAVGDILRGAGIPDGWTGAVVDRNGRFVARSRDDTATVGLPASASVQRAISTGTRGFYKGVTRDGVPVETVYDTVPEVGGWSVHLGVPRQALETPVRRALYAVAVAVLLSVALAAGLVTTLARDLTRRRRSESNRAAAALDASERWAALAVAAADLGTWRWDVEKGRVTGSERCRGFLDLPQSSHGQASWSLRSFLDSVHPDDRGALRTAARRCLDAKVPFEVDFRTLTAPGPARWFHARGRAETGPDGDEIHGILADIGQQKRAEAERSDLLRRLGAAQEDVQRRIAHDLHDQVGQHVTGLSLSLKGLERAIDGLEESAASLDLASRVRWLQELTGTIGRDLHRVASDLRPSALDDLGLPRALVALAEDWSVHYGIDADVQVVGSDDRLPDEIATAIYRVVQEALTNVLKHARARTVSVVLDRRPHEVRLVVEDDGIGFDPDGRRSTGIGERRRLGLLGMRERLNQIGGMLTVESSADVGTTLFVTIPLDRVTLGEDAT